MRSPSDQALYPRLVREGKMREEERTMLMDRAWAIRATLLFCREHEEDIRAYMASKTKGHRP